MSEPLFDVIVPVKERADWLELCLTAVKNFTPKAHTYHLYLIDNICKEPETKALFARAEAGEFGPCTILPGTNESFSQSINMGASAGKGKNIVILNSDAIVTEGWSTAFLSDLSDKKVGITGARSNAAAGLQGGAGVPEAVDPGFVVFVFVGMRREVFETLGGMDAVTFDGFSGEDIDLSLQVTKRLGLRLKLSQAYCLHGLSKSLVREVGFGEKLAKNNEKYMRRLIDKWGLSVVEESARLRPKVMVATFSAEEWVRVDFSQSLFGLRRGTAFDLDMMWFRRMPIHLARKSAIQSVQNINKSLREKQELTFDWLLMVDDDAAGIPPDALMRLLGHKKDVVSCVAYQRGEPYQPCVFEWGEDQYHVNPIDIEGTGLRKVGATGFHMTLFRLSVFDRLTEFPVEQAKKAGTTDLQELHRIREEKGKDWFGSFGKRGEDIHFFGRCKEAGIDVYADGNLAVGHIGAAQIVNGDTRRAFLARNRG